MARLGLLGYVLTFAAGFFYGFMYHHIASMAHSIDGDNQDDDALPYAGPPTSTRIRLLEGRLAAVEARLAAASPVALLAPTAGKAAAVANDNTQLPLPTALKRKRVRERAEKEAEVVATMKVLAGEAVELPSVARAIDGLADRPQVRGRVDLRARAVHARRARERTAVGRWMQLHEGRGTRGGARGRARRPARRRCRAM